MSEQSDRPLANWTTSHLISFVGLLGMGIGSWIALNERVTNAESEIVANKTYRAEQMRRAERIEDKVDRLLMAEGIRPEIDK
jgi:hypothetical protein